MRRLVPGSDNFLRDHLSVYLETRGYEGHFEDLTPYGGTGPTTMLVLKTIGRKTGQTRVVPLIYDNVGSEYVVIASDGGATSNPPWFLNLTAAETVEFEVADKFFRGTWRLPEGAEREQVWSRMAEYYPPYKEYKEVAGRQIPVVMLTATESIPPW